MSKVEAVLNNAPDESTQQLLEKIEKCQKKITVQRNNCDRDIFEIEKKYQRTVRPYIKNRNFFIQNVPKFWSQVFLGHPLLSSVFEQGEKDVLKYLSNVDVEEDDENPDYFKIHFVFEPNPYFQNKVLTKQFTEDGSASTTIVWKDNHKFPKISEHDVWEYDELGLELKGFFRWFCDPEEQFCDPIADIIRGHVWFDPLEFYSNETTDEKESSKQRS